MPRRRSAVRDSDTLIYGWKLFFPDCQCHGVCWDLLPLNPFEEIIWYIPLYLHCSLMVVMLFAIKFSDQLDLKVMNRTFTYLRIFIERGKFTDVRVWSVIINSTMEVTLSPVDEQSPFMFLCCKATWPVISQIGWLVNLSIRRHQDMWGYRAPLTYHPEFTNSRRRTYTWTGQEFTSAQRDMITRKLYPCRFLFVYLFVA